MGKSLPKTSKSELSETSGKRLRDKEQFFANISHEIRTPINAIVAISQILLKTNLDSDQTDLIRTIKQSGEALMRLTNDFLDYTKLGAKQLKVENIHFSIRLLIQELVTLFLPQTNEKGLSIDCHIEEFFPDEIYGDPNRIRQIVINFVSNALKFTDEGGVKITLKRSTTKKSCFSILVKDTGIGICPEKINKLFKEYYQIDELSTRRFGGTGLGLYISKILAELMGGNITVQSNISKGSTFSLNLPLKFEVKNLEQTISHPATKKNYYCDDSFAIRFPLKLLVAEDNPVNQKIIRMFLEKLGYKDTIFVENGLLAVQALKGASFDLVFMDIQMPVMDGVAASEEILKFWQAKPPTIVALTATADNLNPSHKIKSGIGRTLLKPVRMSSLSDTIAEVYGYRFEQAILASIVQT